MSAKAGYEFNAAERYLEAAVSGPISPTLGFRIAGRASHMSGYLTNTSQPTVLPSDPDYIRPGAPYPKSPGSKEYLGRITLEWKPSSTFDASLKVFGSKLTDEGETGSVQLKCAPGHGAPQTFDITTGTFVIDPYDDCTLNGTRSLSGLPSARAAQFPGARDGKPYSDYYSILTSMTMNWRPSDTLTLTSVTGYYKFRNEAFDEFGFSGSGNVWGHADEHASGFSQEIRLRSDFESPINFTLGGYFESSKRSWLLNGMIAVVGLDPTTGRYDNWSVIADNKGKTYSLFGELSWDILENLELAGGVRWTRETKDVVVGDDFVNANFAPFGFSNPQGIFLRGRFEDSNWSPEATLTWHPTPRTTLYVAYKTGYKSGGFSNPTIFAPTASADLLRFDPEYAKGFELGAKGSFLGGRLIVSSAVYTYKFEGLQLSAFNSATVSQSIRNAASARTTGFEIDASFNVNDALSLRGAVGYNRAKYVSYPNAPCYSGQGCTQQDLSGEPLNRAPELNLSGGFTYEMPVSGDTMLGFSLDGKYSSGYWMQENRNPLGYQEGFFLLNGQVRLHNDESGWELALIGRNLTNKYYGISSTDKALGAPGEVAIGTARPREVTLQASVRF